MSLGSQFPAIPALERTFVALDLETTGLYADRGDKIIQMGAVKFQGDRVIDRFDTFVNPGKEIPDFIQRLTGIRPEQVKRAPHFSSVSYDLESFLEGHPVVGQNIRFDLSFLEVEGLSLANPSYDTWDLAAFLLPRNPEYNLQSFIRQFQLSSAKAHQAIDDADAARQLFLLLLRRAANLEPGLLAWVQQLARRSNWRVADLLAGLESGDGTSGGPALFAATGLQLNSLANKVGQPERRRYDSSLAHLDESKAAGLMGPDGPFAQTFPQFEQRPQQAEMLAAVAQAIYQGQHLIVEGGTGVGKSMAYLLPAALYALSRNQRVVISTNTITLQEQLINKDIPALCAVLEAAGVVEPGAIKYALLKGRANYLCLNRWNYLANGDNLTPEEARLLSKTAVWLQDAATADGDRSDLNLGRDASHWSKVSAGERGRCPNLLNGAGPCFVRSSRDRAEQSHIVVVNHALLLSDLMRGGSIIPDYQRVIIDEAHNLEDAATNEFGFEIAPERLNEEVEPLTRLTRETRLALAAEGLDSTRRQQGERLIGDGEALLPPLRDNWANLWVATEIFFNAQRNKKDEDLRIQPQQRSHRSWADLTLAWEKVDVGLHNLGQILAALTDFLENNPIPQAKEQAGLALEAGNVQSRLEELKGQLAAIIGREDAANIHWLRRDQGKSEITFHSAPLDVGPILNERLYSKKESVVLTSATLTIGESFDFPRRRLGLPAAESGQLKVGSPFDYKRAALLLTPEDTSPPNHTDYPRDIARCLVDLGKTLSGRTMALFTSHNTLRNVERRIRQPLKMAGIELLAQNIDGSAQQIGRRFAANHAAAIPTVLLGTNSFWEGVDFPGILKALVITRLPFPVPSNPIIAARSDLYERNKAFNEYSVPLAVLRFRQGMGRLIRNKGDSGVVVVLDQRIVIQGYGRTFFESIPECTYHPVSLSTIGDLAGRWVARDNRGGGRG